ncbi:MAG: sigma-70 family RNA polymerase sigma factor [Terriglobales bacterium]
MPIDSPGPAISEAELVHRAQDGDAEAFGFLFEKHKARVYALCLRMTRNTSEAEDLTQEAFLHVFRKLAAFRADSALSTWLYRVTVNTVLMHFRKKTLCVVSVEKTNNEGNPVPREFPMTDFRLTGCVDRMALNRALAELPNGYRKIFLLHEVAGYEHREIAKFLGCSVGNSKSQLHKARQRIRELLVRAKPVPASHGARNTIEVKSQPLRAWKPSRAAQLPGLSLQEPSVPLAI